jgi:Fe-S-cluster containining protein
MSANKQNKKLKKELCEGCSLCCEYVVIKIETPKYKEDIDEIIWFLLHGIIVFIDYDNSWNVEIGLKCKFLNKNGWCNAYSKRPNICREYSQDECERYKGKKYIPPKKIFDSDREFLKYTNKDPQLKKILSLAKKVKK